MPPTTYIKNTLKADAFEGPITIAAVESIAPLTGTVGTANDVMTAIAAATAATTDTTAASLTSVNTAITAINNDFADLQAKFNALLSALQA